MYHFGTILKFDADNKYKLIQIIKMISRVLKNYLNICITYPPHPPTYYVIAPPSHHPPHVDCWVPPPSDNSASAVPSHPSLLSDTSTNPSSLLWSQQDYKWCHVHWLRPQTLMEWFPHLLHTYKMCFRPSYADNGRWIHHHAHCTTLVCPEFTELPHVKKWWKISLILRLIM
jgi:hypothetical protein